MSTAAQNSEGMKRKRFLPVPFKVSDDADLVASWNTTPPDLILNYVAGKYDKSGLQIKCPQVLRAGENVSVHPDWAEREGVVYICEPARLAGFVHRRVLCQVTEHSPSGDGAESSGSNADDQGQRPMSEATPKTKRKLRFNNRRLSKEEYSLAEYKKEFRSMLKQALARWYEHGFHEADRRLPQTQKFENFAIVSELPNWKQFIVNDSYIMLRHNFSGSTRPCILTLTHPDGRFKGLTYRELYAQVRAHLGLPMECSLRLAPYRPWYAHVTKSINVPERKALPAGDDQCKCVFGTTLVYYAYVHLNEYDDE